MRRSVLVLLAAALAATALAGCGLLGDRGPAYDPVELAAALGPEETALAAIGYHPAELTTADYGDEPGRRWEAWRRRGVLRENLLHGEVVVQTDDGTRTVLVQRGEVTGTTATTVTVTSTDGFAQTWTLGDRLRVLESRTTVEPRELAIGARVAVAGHDRDGTPTANLVFIPAG